jgi:hypothetical protein
MRRALSSLLHKNVEHTEKKAVKDGAKITNALDFIKAKWYNFHDSKQRR